MKPIVQISLDLGDRSEPHNQVEIDTAGNNFRRLVDVGGSADGARWSTLASAAIIFRFAAGGRSVEQLAVDYPVSQYRYLRIRAAPDIHETPEIVARGVDFDLVVVCKLCAECDTFPCVLDAAIFSAQDKDA